MIWIYLGCLLIIGFCFRFGASIKSWLMNLALAYVGIELDKIRQNAADCNGKSVAKLEKRHLVIEFYYEDKLCKLMLPYNRRIAQWDSTVLCIDKDGTLSQHFHPPGIKFPTTASGLGLDQIIRVNSHSQERIVYTGNEDVI